MEVRVQFILAVFLFVVVLLASAGRAVGQRPWEWHLRIAEKSAAARAADRR